MDAFELEQIRKETVDKLNLSISPGQILFVLHKYFNIILSSGNKLFVSSFLIEFIEDYVRALNLFDPFYNNLNFTDDILDQAEAITKQPEMKEFIQKIETPSRRIKQRQAVLIAYLKAEQSNVKPSPGITFPVLEDTNHNNNDILLGFAESVSISINKTLKGKKIFL